MTDTRFLTELRPDEALRMDAQYRWDNVDRRYIDDQIRALQSVLDSSLLHGWVAAYFRIDPAIADELRPRDVVCFAGTLGTITLATPDALASVANRVLGVVVRGGPAGGVACVAMFGVLPPEVTRLDSAGTVGPDANGRLAISGSPTIGSADANGNVFLATTGGGGGSGLPPGGTVGQVVTNTAPGEGAWADAEPGPPGVGLDLGSDGVPVIVGGAVQNEAPPPASFSLFRSTGTGGSWGLTPPGAGTFFLRSVDGSVGWATGGGGGTSPTESGVQRWTGAAWASLRANAAGAGTGNSRALLVVHDDGTVSTLDWDSESAEGIPAVISGSLQMMGFVDLLPTGALGSVNGNANGNVEMLHRTYNAATPGITGARFDPVTIGTEDQHVFAWDESLDAIVDYRIMYRSSNGRGRIVGTLDVSASSLTVTDIAGPTEQGASIGVSVSFSWGTGGPEALVYNGDAAAADVSFVLGGDHL